MRRGALVARVTDAAWAARRLEGWFSRHGRDLPWRRTHDPYEVLVAEFVLQQTRMETGVPRVKSFLRRFPTIRALARAPARSVLAEWSGLGYYARARNLHATARRIVRFHGGRVPSDPATLRELPGIGPYTAGAIASIAFDRPEPSLDGNQYRVLGRYLGGGEPRAASQRRRIEGWARSVLATGSPRRLNQALMDLGSAVCLPRTPRCGECPLFRGCGTRGPGPRTRIARPPAPVDHFEARLHRRGNAVWLTPWRPRGPLRGLWLPPLRRVRRAHGPIVEHRFSHRTWKVALRAARGRPPGPGRWVNAAQLRALPHSGLTRRLLAAA